MRFQLSIKYVFLLLTIAFAVAPTPLAAQQKTFVLVLDPGHGGKDPGAVGRKAREKDVVLSVSKLVGNLVEKNMDDVNVVYTRKTDVFIPLEKRAQIANDSHADMFISIHCNAAENRSAYGAETFVLGLAKSKANLDVAMKENSVIMLEDDYKTRYQGFDPNSVDSYIMFEFMMDKYLENSVLFATDIQKQFAGPLKRLDRGVRQAGFWVLHRTASPSVLVELGFLSNYQEELFLASDKGQQDMARAIYNAFVHYKKDHDRKMGYTVRPGQYKIIEDTPVESTANNVPAVEPTETAVEDPASTVNSQLPVFKLQIRASATSLPLNSPEFKGQKNVDSFREGGMYKYTVGAETDYSKINALRKQLSSKFPDAFVIAFVGDKKISVNEALKLIK